MTDITGIFPGGFSPRKYAPMKPEVGRDSMLGYALSYARLGWRVLPVHGLLNGQCTCGDAACKSPGKHPRIKDWATLATTEPAVIEGWWRVMPQSNIGIATGPESGIWCLDIDVHKGGQDTLDRWEAEHGKLPDTVTAITGSGGTHYVFAWPEAGEVRSATNVLGPGVDTRGAGGQFVVEPSMHVSGTAYTWEGSSDPLEGHKALPAGEALERAVAAPRSAPAAPMTSAAAVLDPGKVAELRGVLTYIPADDRDIWIRVGMALHSTGAGAQAYGLWCEWSQLSPKYDPDDQRRVWDSMRRDGGGVTLSTLYGMAKGNGWVDPGQVAGVPVAYAQAPVVVPPAAGFEFISAAELVSDPQPPTWCVVDVLEASTLAVIYGDSDAYKSFIALDLGLHVAAGRAWHGKPVRQGAVFYIAGEGHRGIGRRVAAWCKWHQQPGQIPFYASRTSAELTSYTSAYAVSEAVAAMVEAAGEVPAMIIIDTLAANFGAADENSAKDMGAFLNFTQRLLRERFDATVLVVHHVGHGDKKRERGSYALRGNVDARLLVERTNDLESLVTCEKMKDAERFAPMRASLAVVPLGIVDSEGRPVTSLTVTTAVPELGAKAPALPPPPPSRKARGTNQTIALRELARLQREQEERLGGVGIARVAAKDLREALEAFDIGKARYYEVIRSLADGGMVTTQHPHIALTEAGWQLLEEDE
ncbi:MAG: bifunctional DNA primase/polymerase [Gammaproteobacteria bacterium]|nr:bifunctional DNA primase/polymerase [Gammaproteobacteria bacterium]